MSSSRSQRDATARTCSAAKASRACSLLALVLALWSPAAAQQRQGVWGEFSLGAATHGITVADDSPLRPLDGREWGGVSGFCLGWALNRRTRVGVELKGTAGSVDRVDWTLFCVCGAIWFYPGPSNLFIKAGGGGAFLAGSTEVGIDETHGGLGLTTGVGYDIYLGRRFSLTPAIGFWYASPGDLQRAGQTLVKSWKHNAVDFTVAIKFD